MPDRVVMDGNEATADVAYRSNEVIVIYPITPASPMGEHSDAWAARGRPNLWGATPVVQEMQSEGGAAGAVHGALQTGALATTFTASQGLLLMLPNLYKIAGELTPAVFHIAARTVATHALSIFCDHSDVMACRQAGWAILFSGSVQQAADFAAISQAATLTSRIPFLNCMDGFRTSHELQAIQAPSDDVLRGMYDADGITEHRRRALSPDHPVIRGTAQNPDVFFQAREASNPYYDRCPAAVREAMTRYAELTGRRYDLFEYFGHPEADRVLVLMGSATETARATVEHLADAGERVGVVAVRLYRPFVSEAFLDALPVTTRAIAVLDRTKEPGAAGEPLFQDVVTAVHEGADRFETPLRVIGGRYGLSSKEFTPAMVKAALDELEAPGPRRRFTVGIADDIGGLSLEVDPEFRLDDLGRFDAVFYGLGSDGTVSANKSSIHVIGETTGRQAQGYFEYDSKKAGSVTVSHLRFGWKPIRAPYLVEAADFVACHQFGFLERFDVLRCAKPGAVFLLNSPYGPYEVWKELPGRVQRSIREKRLDLHVVDAARIAREAGLGGRINTVMQTCFFALSDVVPAAEAIERIKQGVRSTYGKRGDVVVERNYAAIEAAARGLSRVRIPDLDVGAAPERPTVDPSAPELVQTFTARLLERNGDFVPVSALTADGTFPTGTAQWEKRSIAAEIPIWDPAVCIQCAKCALVCPHAAIRVKAYPEEALAEAPGDFPSIALKDPDYAELKLRITYQTAPEDCTGCGLCVHVCPAKNKSEARLKAINMTPQRPVADRERERYRFFLSIPEIDRAKVRRDTIKGSQLLQPLFEYSGACAGCGETPYLKLLTQMFGERLLVANATGCSSIYGGNLPTTPWTKNAEGRGPAWSNSLFEDNAEFGLGYRLTLDQQRDMAARLLDGLRATIGADLVDAVLTAEQADEADIAEQRGRIAELRRRLAEVDLPEARRLSELADTLVAKSVWLVGGDGWAYDIGYGGLDHVLSTGRNVNILVLDTEVYSNTGGQMSKSTPRAAVAKFAAGGKRGAKKDLGLHAMLYGNVYVASVAMGASDAQCVRAFAEAEAYPGPSLILAYSHCIAHGIRMETGMDQQRKAVRCGYWPLYRFDPRRTDAGENPLQLDWKKITERFEDYAYNETRYRILAQAKPDEARELLQQAQRDAAARRDLYERLAAAPATPQEENR